jgi:hypothetical protein
VQFERHLETYYGKKPFREVPRGPRPSTTPQPATSQ